jgi:hypothetical protein
MVADMMVADMMVSSIVVIASRAGINRIDYPIFG